MILALALFLTLVSACALNAGYLIEHSVASQLPRLSFREPVRSVRLRLGQRRWLAGGHAEGSDPGYAIVLGWLGASGLAAAVTVKLLSARIDAGPAYGIATGLLFAAGDIATKMAVKGGDGGHLAFFAALIAFYAVGTGVLQAGFQRAAALTTAGIATLLTNALPIVAGMTIFGEPLPGGWLGALRIAAFAAVIAGAVLLAQKGKGAAAEARHQGVEPHRPSTTAPGLSPTPTRSCRAAST